MNSGDNDNENRDGSERAAARADDKARAIGDHLRRVYQNVLDENVPDQMLDLLEQLSEPADTERKSQEKLGT